MNFDPALDIPNVRAGLRVIRSRESCQTEEAYRMLFGGGLFEAPPWEHPRLPITKTLRDGKTITSTAAGAYQFIARTWDGLQAQNLFTDFSPINQDRAAVALIEQQGALGDLINGNFSDFLRKCSPIWASLPYAEYGQPTQTFAQAMETYTDYGGRINQESA